MDIYELITTSVKQNASDLHLSSGNLPIRRIYGDLYTFDDKPLSPQQLEEQLLQTLTVKQKELFAADHQLDYSLTVAGNIRLRVNLFRQRQGISAVFRFIPSMIPLLPSLLPPDIFHHFIGMANGLILVTGATGSGKSTTLASLIQEINLNQKRHVITLEDPIEFIHQSSMSLIQQREVGPDVNSFEHGLYAALREDPDIILLGELRGPETISLALTAAETGHLVLASLHTRSAIQSIERIIDVFPAEDKPFVRNQLANSLKAVISQTLLPRIDSGRVAAFEVLTNTPAVGNMIREGKLHQLYSVLQTGQSSGMQTMEQAVSQREREGLIEPLFKPAF